MSYFRKNKKRTGFTRPKFFSKNLGGFTIVELLVVIALAAVIFSIFFVMVKGARAKSRDTLREQNIKQIQNGLALYATSKGTYPICGSEIIINGQTDCLSTALLSEEAMKGKTPIDPRNVGVSCGDATSYLYCYVSADGSNYTLRYNLETDSITGKSAGWQRVNP